MRPYREHHLLSALRQWEIQKGPLDLSLYHFFKNNKSLGSKDRAFIAEHIYTLVRWQGLLDWFCKPPVSWEKRWEIFCHHRLDQLRQVPDLPVHVRVSFPKWLFTKLQEEYGEAEAFDICQICNTQAPATIRANPLKISRDELFNELLQSHGVKKTAQSSLGITFEKRLNFFELSQFKSGFFEVQDEGSQLLAELIQPDEGDQVLDFCAGSGGKALAFAHHLKSKGQIYLHDIRKSALLEAKKRLKRAGIQNAQIVYSNHPNLKKLKKKMHWVLVDAPCSGTGTLRRNPDMKWKLTNADVTRLIGEQRKVFEQALSYVAPQGKIVYATCSILQEENEDQTQHFLRTYPIQLTGIPLKLLPTLNGSDGFYGVSFQLLNSS